MGRKLVGKLGGRGDSVGGEERGGNMGRGRGVSSGRTSLWESCGCVVGGKCPGEKEEKECVVEVGGKDGS